MSYLSMSATNLKHEFRATWLTTAWGNDWPKKTQVTSDATRKQQQDSLIAIFDRLQAGNMNAVCFQVRARSDAFYQSSYEPWAAELAGARGKDPGYDPLAFAIEEAHKRGLELHAWVNPFRVTSSGTLSTSDKVWLNAGQWIIQYNNGSFSGQIIDPGYPEAREYVLNVLMEIVNNYDIDGIVMDDYFYPYGGTTTEDAASKALYKPNNVVDVNQDGDTDDDWRRSNVDVFLEDLYNQIQATKPWVRFGMGTFGIWTTQTKVAQAYGISLPSGISGLDDYDVQACNPVEWVKNGYVDYINPQLYWPTTSTGQNYNKLCHWWAKDVCEHFSNQLTNGKKVHFFSSQSISANPTLSEIQSEIDVNRNNLSSGSTGSVFFDTDAYLTMDKDLMTSRFATNALTPPMDWKSNTALAAPTNLTVSGSTLTWQHPTAERFTVYVYPKGTAWSTAKNDPSYLQGVIYGNSMDISGIDTNMNDIAVCAYDRFGVEHTAAVYSNDSGAGTTPNPETIIWELNGGEVNTVTVEVPSLTTLEAQFKNDYNSYFGAAVATTREITNFLYYGSKEESGSNLVYNMMNDPVADWTWLRDYIISKSASNTTIQTALLAGTDAHWRYSIVAFLTASAGTNSTYTVDFSIAGQPSKWGTAYQIAHGAVLLPTYVTSAYTLPTPTHPEGLTFLGWYDNPAFSGSSLTIIPAHWTGTLYAKWQEDTPTIDPTWQITYTSSNDSIVTPYATDVFGANIVSNTYENGVGTITFDGPVTSIGDWAFWSCESLTSVTLPNSVTSIGDYAFYQCTSLTSITLPNSVTRIGNSAFEYSSLTSITLPNSVTSIGDRAFSGCDSPISIVVEDGNATYDSRTNCNAIIETATNTLIAGCQNTIIPNSVTSIGSHAFLDCSSLTSITIPNSVTSIGSYAFHSCDGLTSITIPNSVTSIGGSAFFGCSSLTDIAIPNSVTSIGDDAFSYCGAITSMVVENGNTIYDSRENCNAIIETATNTLIAGCQNTIIPNSVTSIGGYAFRGCSSLTSITIPNSVTSIGYEAFRGCSSLTSITIPNGVTSIGEGAFQHCTSLTSITIPNSVTSIGETAFGWCSSLTSITIPNSVTSIGEGAFDGCSSLDTIYVEATTPPALEDSTVFMNTPAPVCVIPCGTLATYQSSDWANQVGSFVEDCPPASAAITYVLNGGVQSEWETPQTMYNELNAVWNAFSGTSKTWGNLEDLKANVANGIPTQAGTMALDFIADENFKAKFEWLVTYMDAKCTEQGQTLPSSNASFLRYNLQAFFIDGMRTSWPISADYTICGVSTVEAYQPYWKSGFANPTNPTEEFILNAPYREGYTFAGWYTTPDFSGKKVTTVNSETTGTLYAKWIEYIPTIAEVWNMEEGVETKISGVVNWVRYGNVFIQDITGGFRVYIPNDSTRLIPEVGTKIIAKGVRGSFAGSPQLNDAVIESLEPATLADPVVTTLEDLCANPLKYFGQRVFVEVVYVAEYDTYGNIYVAERDGSNKVKGHYMVVDPIAFPVGTKVSITAVASQYDGAFQFEGDIAGIELAPGPKRDTYEYPVRNEKYTLTNDWVISNIEGNLAANKLAPTDSWFVRGMAAKDGIMYFINRETQSLIRVDGATGHMLDPIKITGEHLFEVYDEEMGEWKSGVIFGYNDIKFDQAGNCLIGAMMTGAAKCQTFFIYVVDLETGVCTKLIEDVLWDNPSLDQVQFRFDAFGVAGDVTKNGVVMAADAQSWNVYRWLIKNGVVGDGEQINCALNAEIDESLFIETENFGTAPQIFPQDELGELFYVDGASTLPMLFDGDGMLLDDFINVPTGTNVWNSNGDTISINTGHLNGLIEFQVGEEYFLLMAATYSTHNVPSTFALYKFADENRAFSDMEPLWYFPHNGMGSATNGYRTAVPSVDIIDNNTAKLYLYVGENGYACYTLTLDNVASDEVINEITYELNGGVTNDYGWINKGQMFEAFMTDAGATGFKTLDYYLQQADPYSDPNICTKLTNASPALQMDKWAWLKAYIEAAHEAQTANGASSLTADGTGAAWRYAVAAFFVSGQRTSWPKSADFSELGLDNVYLSAWQHAYDNPTNPTEEFILNAPYREGYTFAGWYTTPDFSGEKVTTINSETTGTLYAKWIDDTWVIKYTSTDGNIVTPYATDVFGANIVSNIYENGVGTITFDGPVTSIGENAFRQCSSIASITIPKSVTSIGQFAFGFCSSLTSITIPENVTSIVRGTFQGCSSIVSIVVDNNNTMYDSRNDCNAIIETATNVLVTGCKNTIIPNGITTIDRWAFASNKSLASITIPNTVMTIADHAFHSCSSLPFISIPNSVTSIGVQAFYNCSLFSSFTIPKSVTTIGKMAFKDCTSLDTIYVEATTPPTLGENVLGYSPVFTSSPLCYLPCGTLSAYEASDWAQYVSEFVEEGCAPIQMCGDDLYWEYADGVLTITGTGDMYDYAADTDVPWYDVRGDIKTVSLPDAMTKIGDYAFYKCTEVTSINMPTTLTAIGEKAFAQDTKLACEIILPASMTTIASRAFFNCKAVPAFHVEATTPPTVQTDAFDYTTAPIHVPCGYGHVYGKHTQWGMLNLKMCELLQDNVYYYPIDGHTARAVTYHSNPTDTIVIPSAVVIDGMPRTVTEVADFAFTDCANLPAISFNEGLEYIGERAFVRCYGLHGTIVLPATLETIGERAFSYCDNVEKYLIQAMTPPALGDGAFTCANHDALFYVSCEVMDDYKVATNWSSLKSRLRDACLNIYHYNTALGANGVHTTEDTLVASVYYRRRFTTSRWETLYLPFEVDRVTVLEDGVEYDLKAWSIFSGGHYYLAKPYGTENKEVVFGFTQVVDAHTPYIIQFKEPYFHDKMITFYGKESWNKLSTSFEALPISFEMQMAGNTTLQDQILEEPVYMLRASSNFLLQNTTTTLHPFECYVMPYATPSGAPARMNVRFRGDVPTAVESVKGNESHLTYSVDGYTLTVYPQGQAFSIYSLNGALIYSCEAGKEAVDCELNSGCYLLHAGAEAHKIML